MGSVSTIKASAGHNLLTGPSNNCFVVRPKQWLHLHSKATWRHRRMEKWFERNRKGSEGLEHRCYHGRQRTCSISSVLSRSWATSQRALSWPFCEPMALSSWPFCESRTLSSWPFCEPIDPWWASSCVISRHKQAHPSHFRWLQSRGTAVGNPHNCRSRPWWRCEYKCDMERCTGTCCDQQLVQIVRLGLAQLKPWWWDSPSASGLRNIWYLHFLNPSELRSLYMRMF